MSQNDDAPTRVPHLGNMTMEEFYPLAEAAQMFSEFATGWQGHSTIKLDIRFDFTPGQNPSLRVAGIRVPMVSDNVLPIMVNLAPPTISDLERIMFRPEADVPPELVETIPAKSEPPVDASTGEPAARPLPPPQAPAAGTPSGINEIATAGQKQAPWTEGQDAQFVVYTAAALADGMTRNAAVAYAALTVDRPFQGALFRANTKLRDRIDAAVVEIRAAKKNAPALEQTELPKSVLAGVGDVSPAMADVAAPPVAGPVGAAAAAPTAEEVVALAWVKLLPPSEHFSPARDYDLLHFAGLRWPMGDIAAEFGIGAEKCKARYEQLTQSRKLSVTVVMAALIHLHPELAQNAA